MPKRMKLPRTDKKRKGSSSLSPEALAAEDPEKKKEFVGCPVAEPIICGLPKCAVDDEDGVSMICTNEFCPFADQKLHPQCFHELEESMVKRMRTQGSARDWTDAQRRNNLWERKGLSLVGKYCRCRCGLGQTRLDKDAAFEKEKAKKREAKKEKKKKCHKDLPSLHFSHHADDFRKKSSVDPRSSKSHYCDSNASLVVPDTPNDPHEFGESNGSYRNYDFNFKADTLANDVFDDHVKITIVPAPLPPQQTRSYASLIKDGGKSSEVNDITNAYHDSGFEQDNRSTSIESGKAESEESVVNASFDEFDHVDGFPMLSPIPTLFGGKGDRFGTTMKNEPDWSKPVVSQIPTTYPVTSTPISKRTNRYVPPHLRRRSRQSSSSTIRIGYLSDEEPKCEIVFKKKPVRDVKKEIELVEVKDEPEKDKKSTEKDGELIYGWTPFFGYDFNLGERFMFIP